VGLVRKLPSVGWFNGDDDDQAAQYGMGWDGTEVASGKLNELMLREREERQGRMRSGDGSEG
jgi:hypothetical protein